MHLFFDTETNRFRPGCMAPPVVCVQFCVDDNQAHLMTARGEFAHASGALSPPTSHTFPGQLAYWLNQGATLVGHNVAYDLACLCALPEAERSGLIELVFRAYRENRITDTMWRQKLADIGRGKYRSANYDLGSVGSRHGYRVNKDDPWRLHYDLLADVPLSDWPQFQATVPKLKDDAPEIGKDGQPVMLNLCGEDAIRYALGDPLATRAAYVGQATRYDPALLCDEFNQARKFWSLQLMSVWGLRTSLRGVLSLERGATERRDELGVMLREVGLVRADGSRNTEVAKQRMRESCAESGVPLRLTKSGDVCLDSDACEGSGDPMLEAYQEFSSMTKVISNDVAALRRGVVVPLHPHFDLAKTSRVTASRPNTMNPRRLAGVRECYVPRGYTG